MAIHSEIVDENLHTPCTVAASDPGAIGAGMMWVDTTSGTGSWVAKIRNAGDTGWEEVGRSAPDPLDIPHMYKGSEPFNVYVIGQVNFYITGAYGQTTKVSARDVIKGLRGGVASPTYTYYVKKDGGSYGAGNSDPTAEYVTYDGDEVGFQTMYVKVSDGTTTTTEQALFVSVEGATS